MGKIKVILQARTHSTRLPNKVMLDISGKPMLWHVIERLKHAKLVDDIIVTTTSNPDDKVLVELAEKCGVKYFQGSEEDVLDRYYRCILKHDIGVVVNITGDCPFVDPEIVDFTIKTYLDNKNWAEYVRIYVIENSFPRGLDCDVMPAWVLGNAWINAKTDFDKSNATSYIYMHPEIFNVLTVKLHPGLSSLRWTVDEYPDLKFVREVYKRLYCEGSIFHWYDVLDLLYKEPEIMDINRAVRQKAIEEG